MITVLFGVKRDALFGYYVFFSRKYIVRDIVSEGAESNEILGKKCYLAAGYHNFWLGSKPTKNCVGLYESQEGKCLNFNDPWSE